MTGRRALVVAVAGMVLGGALALFAASRGWLTIAVARDAPLGPLRRSVKGSTAQPLLTAMGILALAGVVALFATRRVGRTLVGVVVALAGAVLVVRVATDASGVSAGRARSLLADSGPVVGVRAGARVSANVHAASVAMALVAGGLLLLAGVLVVARGHRWPGMGARYDRPEQTEKPAVAGDRQLWDALDRGDDPTSG